MVPVESVPSRFKIPADGEDARAVGPSPGGSRRLCDCGVMGNRQPRNRVLGDRLWDDTGGEWRRVAGQWADVDEVERRLADARVVLLYGFGRPLQWLTLNDAAHR